MPIRRFPLASIPFLLVIAVATGLRIASLPYGFPDVYYADEDTVIESALYTLTGDLDPHLTKYPHFLVNALALAFHVREGIGLRPDSARVARAFVAYQETPHSTTLLARGFALAASLVAVPLTFLIGRRLWGSAEGLIAATLLVLSPLHIDLSRLARVDGCAVTLVALATFFSVRYLDTGRAHDIVGAGLSAGAALGCKYYPGLVAIVGFLLIAIRGGPARTQANLAVRLAIAGAAAFCLSSPALVTNIARFAGEFREFSTHLFRTPHLGTPGRASLAHELLPLLRYTIGSAGCACLVVFAIHALASKAPRARADAVVVLAYPALLALLFLRSETFVLRFFLTALPPLCLGAARGATLLCSAPVRGERPSKRRVAFCLVVFALGAAPFLRDSADTALRTVGRRDTRLLAHDWIEANVPADQPLLLTHRRLAPYFPTRKIPFAHPANELWWRVSTFAPRYLEPLQSSFQRASEAVARGDRKARYVGDALGDGLRRADADPVVVVPFEANLPDIEERRAREVGELAKTHRQAAWFPETWSDSFGPPIGIWVPREPGP